MKKNVTVGPELFTFGDHNPAGSEKDAQETLSALVRQAEGFALHRNRRQRPKDEEFLRRKNRWLEFKVCK